MTLCVPPRGTHCHPEDPERSEGDEGSLSARVTAG